MNNAEILANAPEGATHESTCDGFTIYLSSTGYGWACESEDYFDVNDVGKNPLNELADIRSLSDIKRITELERERENSYLKWQQKYSNLKDDMEEMVRKHAILSIQVAQPNAYVDHALDNSKETLIKRIAELEKALTDAHENIGSLAMHLHGRMAEGALLEMATKADEWKELLEQDDENTKNT